FQSRQIDITAAHLEELAGKLPEDAKAEVAQLLAIRWLGEHRVEAARGTLQRIAQGQIAQDKHRFAQDYARRALAALDGQRPARPLTTENSLRQALEWFPEETTLAVAVDLTASWANKPFRIPAPPNPDPAAPAQKPFVFDLAHLQWANWEPLYQAADELGNIRFQRVALAYPVPLPPDREGLVMVRLTWLAN